MRYLIVILFLSSCMTTGDRTCELTAALDCLGGTEDNPVCSIELTEFNGSRVVWRRAFNQAVPFYPGPTGREPVIGYYSSRTVKYSCSENGR